MRFSDPLHLGALLFGVGAAFWAISTLAGYLFVPGVLVLLAGAIVLLFARRLEATSRRFLVMGASLSIATHALLIVAFAVTQPFGFGRDPDRAVTVDPPAWGAEVMTIYAPLYMILVAALAVFTFYHTWGRTERGLGIAGIIAVAIGLALGYATTGGSPGAVGVLISLLIAAGFASIATAILIPPIRAENAPWRPEETPGGARGPAATGNP